MAHVIISLNMTQSTKRNSLSRFLRTIILYCGLCLMSLPSSSSQPTGDCPYDGLLVLRPADPFITIGKSSTLCCLTIDLHSREVLPEQPSDELVFTCADGSVLSPLVQSNSSSSSLNSTACATVTVTSLNQQGFCKCEVVGQPRCQASQYLTVDHPLPSSFDISCITYESNNVTCSLKVPKFIHVEKVLATIKWAQSLPNGELGPLQTKVCHMYDSCVLFARDGIMFGLPIDYNISVDLIYDLWGRHADLADHRLSLVSSHSIIYNIMTKILLAPLQATVAVVNRTSVTIRWPRQFTAMCAKTIRIDYVADQDAWKSFNSLDVTEEMRYISDPVEVVLPHLRPFTTYMIILRTKTVDSRPDMWSRPKYLTATTRP